MDKLILGLVLLLSCALTLVYIIPVQCTVTFTPEDKFVIPEYNSQICFTIGGSYESATLENNTWNFVGLALDNYVLNITAGGGPGGVVYGRDVLDYSHNDGNFSISAQNCDVTITNLDIIVNYAPHIGWLNYTVRGVGTQTFNLFYFYNGVGPWNWTVYIDRKANLQNEGWSITTDDELTVTGAKSNVSIYWEKIYPPKGEPSDSNENNMKLIIFSLVFVVTLLFITALILKYKRKQKTLALPLEKNSKQ